MEEKKKIKIRVTSDGTPHSANVIGVDEQGQKYDLGIINQVEILVLPDVVIAKVQFWNPELDIIAEVEE